MSDIEHGPQRKILEFKSDGEAMTVSGYVSTYGNMDHGGDVVLKGAFDGTLDRKSAVRFLFAHDSHQVLGVPLELRTDDKGLFGRFKISQTQLGRDVHTLLKDGALDSFSIGYVPSDIEYDGETRLLKSIDLLECSVVAMPMNQHATVTAVKAKERTGLKEDVPFEDLLTEVSEYVNTLNIAAEAAEALQARRAQSGRKLAEAHIDAIKALLDQAGAGIERLGRIIDPPPPSDDRRMKFRLKVANWVAAHKALETY